MTNFSFYAPTMVAFGKGTQQETGTLAKQFGATRALVHYGSERVKQQGLLDEVCQSLAAAGIEAVTLGGVVPNPQLAKVQEGIALARAEGVDFIVAVGGGSVIDSAKAIAYGVPYEGDVWDFYAGKASPAAALPVGAVLTIAAAGSEMSSSSVISNTETGEKRGCNSDYGRCRFAVMNPELTLGLPAYPTACGVADILMHTLERYFTGEEPMELTMGIAEALLANVMLQGRALTRKPTSYSARAELMWAGSLSHNGLTGAGGGAGDWACHQMGHEISARWDTAHGAALTILWGSWARYVYKENVERFARLAVEVLEVEDEGSDEQLALAGIEELESYFWALELPISFEDAGIELAEADIDAMVAGCTRQGTATLGSLKVLAAEDIRKIYEMARHSRN